MYGDNVSVEDARGSWRADQCLPMDLGAEPNDARLRHRLLKSPHVIPVDDIDPKFGPLVPLCSGLGSDAGMADLAFISPGGRLTLVECTGWRHPEAQREVIARFVDHARAMARWAYADLHRHVAKRTIPVGRTPHGLVRDAGHDVPEAVFAAAVSRSLREGRFLLLIAGNEHHARAEAGTFAKLVDRDPAMAFSFGIFDVPLCPSERGPATQPRILAHSITI